MLNLKHPQWQTVLSILIAGIVLSVLAPFGTDHYSIILRVIYWTTLCLAGGIGAVLSGLISSKWMKDISPWVHIVWQSIGASLLVFLLLVPLYRPSSLSAYLLLLFYIWTIAIVITFINVLLSQNTGIDAISKTRHPVLLQRLAPPLRNAMLLAIKSEDHYVHIYTSEGNAMILMRLSDAIKEVETLSGLSPHRSWWIAEQGIKAIKRQDGKTYITLKNDVIAPISRTGMKTARKAGWI